MSLGQWIDERTGLTSAWKSFTSAPAPTVQVRKAVFAALVYLFVQQAVLGVVLATYYSPSASDAWASTAYISDQVTMGWFIRGMHDHGASAFVVVAALNLATLVLFGGYRRPWELVWLAAIGLFGLGLAEGLTGNPLPWDETGYWAIQVELGIAEQTPGGAIIRRLVQGGSMPGNLTITRLFVLHAFVLPLVIGGLMWFVSKQRRRHALAEAELPQGAVAYGIGQLFVDMVAMVFVAGVVIWMTIDSHGTELFAPADPTSGFQARPEWYFLFLYKLRMFFEGPLEPVATMVIPGAVVGFLVMIPAFDSLLGRLGRAVVLTGFATVVVGVVGLTGYAITSDREDEEYQKALKVAEAQSERARGFAREGVVPEGGSAVFWNDPEFKVKQLFAEHCQNCHAIGGFGGGEAPELTDYSSREYLAALVRDPSQDRFFGKTKHSDMDAYGPDKLDEAKLAATVEFLVNLAGDDDNVDAALVAKGKVLWDDELDCNACHEIEPGKAGDAPNLSGHGSEAWVQRVIRDASAPDLFGSSAQMPKFAEKLSDEAVAALATFVVSQRHKSADDESPSAPEGE